MPDKRWQRVKDIFGAALERPPEARAAFLQEACGGDEGLRRHVESLLSARPAGGFLSTPAGFEGEGGGPSSHLAAGTRLGPYEVVAFVGAGGMGDVYKARDTRLDRVVAIKMLPGDFAADPARRERFEREARAISRLSHPNICALHDVGEHDGARFLVMEYLEGETLAERLATGPLPLAEAFGYAMQIAGALEEAHEHRIVHRDLKPANVVLTKKGAKLLDFGIAKLRSAVPQNDTTRARTLTREGHIVGTLQYMAPEQLEGGVVDARTDVFAFGLLLYEMVTGAKAFHAPSGPGLIAAILKSEPRPLSEVLPLAPAELDATIRRCLAKNPGARWPTAAELLPALRGLQEGGRQPRPVITRRRVAFGVRAVAAAALAGVVLLLILLFRPPSPPSPPLRKFAVYPPEGVTFALDEAPVLSPDGRHLAFVGIDESGKRLVRIRALDDLEARPLAGTEGVAWAAFPFWSPDGRSIGFFADGQLKRVALSGGPPVSLAQATDSRGGAWSPSGVILFSPSLQSPLFRVSDRGGAVTQLTSLDASRQEISHRLPSFLPDGERFLFVIHSGRAENSGLYMGSLGSSTRTRIGDVQTKAVFVPPSHLLFTRGATLVAQRFDPDRHHLSGDPVVVGEPVAIRIGVFGERAFSAARDGTLAYRGGGASSQTELAWFDRSGTKLDVVGDPSSYQSVALSPDGLKVAFERWDEGGGFGVWVHDFKRGVGSPFSVRSTGDWGPIWDPSGDRIAFGSLRGGYSSIYVKAYPGGEDDQLLLDTGHFTGPTDWSADGRSIVFVDISAADVGIVPIGGQARPILTSKFVEKDGRLSPDGRWLAFTSNESGTWEAWLQSFPEPRSRVQVSTRGGSHPEWEPSGKELFYVAPDGTLMAVMVRGKLPANLDPPRPLFRAKVAGHLFKRSYAVARGGQRFLMVVTRDKESRSPITVITNWKP